MKFGLSNADFKTFDTLVIQPLKSESVKLFLFGSRATLKHHPFSDLDLLVDTTSAKNFSSADLAKIKEAIEESRFPIKVDFVLLDELAESYRTRVFQERIEL